MTLLQGEITKRLGCLADGRVLTELAIQTSSGIRVPDVAWGSNEYIKSHINEVFATSAPEVCVEIISPSNYEKEIQEKIQLFLETGAIDVWIVNETGVARFYEKGDELNISHYAVNLDQLI